MAKKKDKKSMRRTRHLKRSKKRRDRKSSPNHKDRSYYIRKERKAIIELRNGKLSYDEWKEQNYPDM